MALSHKVPSPCRPSPPPPSPSASHPRTRATPYPPPAPPWATHAPLFAAAALFFLPKLDPELIMSLRARATVLMGVPTFYTRLLQSPNLTKVSTAHMRLFVSGSAPLLAETHREWSARPGHAVLGTGRAHV